MDTFDARQFRDILGLVPTSVVVVTGFDVDGAPQGITIGSFVSVSLHPPLVGFLPGVTSQTWNAVEPTQRFCINVLAENQSDLCWRFAQEAENRFEGVEWMPSVNGAPALAGSLAYIDCTLHSNDMFGDHYFVVGEVTNLRSGDNGETAMAFYRGKVVGVSRPA